jgi:hypothetical protein
MTTTALAVLALTVLAVLAVGLLTFELRRKNMHVWLGSYLARRVTRPTTGPIHVMFCFVDHFEPRWGNADYPTEQRRVDEWCQRYPQLAARHSDADGCAPKHTFFYPEEEYRREHLDKLAAMCARGFGEIEVHLHHDRDTEAGLREKLTRFARVLCEDHDALPRDKSTGAPLYSFIHGNWCLDNSRADGRWCGVNNELMVLKQSGCYADFTLPSAPSDTQTRKINSIYYATDDPSRPKSHDNGVDVAVGKTPVGDLMLVQGPLALNWRQRKWGLLPRIENADIRANAAPDADRIDLWIRQHIHVAGRPDWIFVKVHTHGTQERDMPTLLGEPVDRMFTYLENRYNDGRRHVLHYVTARETYNIIKAAEAGLQGDPQQYRDFVVARPGFAQPRSAASRQTRGEKSK